MSAFRVIEELSRIDSAAGWNVAQANNAEPFGAWFSDETTAEVFGSTRTVLAGGFFPPRRAVPVEGGYRLSGRCTFNSNCHAATWILGLAHVYDDGVQRLDENGAAGHPDDTVSEGEGGDHRQLGHARNARHRQPRRERR